MGGRFSAELGGKHGGPGDGTYRGEFEVCALSDSVFVFTGAMFGGATAHLGPMALVRVLAPGCDIRAVIGSQRFQCLDQATFRHLGVDPQAARIGVVKSTVHFRADFEPIAEAVWPVLAPVPAGKRRVPEPTPGRTPSVRTVRRTAGEQTP